MTRCPFAKANAGTIVSHECDKDQCEWWARIYQGTKANGDQMWTHNCSIKALAEFLGSIDWTLDKMRE